MGKSSRVNLKTPYHYVRFRWGDEVQLGDVVKDIGKDFIVKIISLPKSDVDPTIRLDNRYGLQITADTLTAFLAGARATLSQKKVAPLTERDLKLRQIILDLYPKNRPTIIHLYSQTEPEFDVEK